MSSEKKVLYRDTENQKIFGVCAGLADYLSLDVTLVRVITVLLIVFGGMSLWVYIILAIVIDPKSVVMKRQQDQIHEAETVESEPDDDPFAQFDKKNNKN
jgi:phage shock protein C